MGKLAYTFDISREQSKALIRGNPPERLTTLLQNLVDVEDYESAQLVKEVIDEDFMNDIKDQLTIHTSRKTTRLP